MARNLVSKDVKIEFGRRLRNARDAKHLSRASLGLRLGISPKTIQSWEMGRTFIEDLALIPAIESELGISVSELIARAIGGTGSPAPEARPAAAKRRARPVAGPVAFAPHVQVMPAGIPPTEEAFAAGWVAVPLIRPPAVAKPVSELAPRDVAEHVVVPGGWVPRGGVLVAYRMPDSGMMPMIPLGGVVVVDRRPLDLQRVVDRVVAMQLHGKGMRIRRLEADVNAGKYYGVTVIEGRRGKLPFRPAAGDALLGRVVGVLAQPE